MIGLAAPRWADPFAAGLPPRPYPGLRPFQSDEWPIFFGREPMTDRVIDLTIAHQMVVVHGDSGCGKSSLIRAGVLVQLEQGHAATGGTWRTAAMLPREDPLGNLARALATIEGSGDPRLVADLRQILDGGAYAPETVATLLRRGDDDHLCILIDQFEELFRHAKAHRDEAACFAAFLTSLATDPPPGLHAILTMRSEFLGSCARFEGFAEAVNRTQYLLPRMEHPALMRAIQEPARLYDGRVSAALAERLIADAEGGQDQLPLIQHGLMLLWQRKVPRGGLAEAPVIYGREPGPAWTLDLPDYEGAGGLDQLLSDHADRVMAEVAPDEERQRIVEHLFRALTDINAKGHAIRRPQTVAQLRAVTGAAPDTLDAILRGFRAEGVSFLNPYGDGPLAAEQQVDISHEALIRCWRKIAAPEDGWLQREFQDGLVWKTLLVMVDKGEPLSAAGTTDREQWLETLPSRDWAERYGGRWDEVAGLVAHSRKIADAAKAKEEREAKDKVERAEQLRQEQQRRAEDAIAAQRRQRRWTFGAVAFAVLAIVAAVLAWSESNRAEQEAVRARVGEYRAETQRTLADLAAARARVAQEHAEAQRDAAEKAEARAKTQRARADEEAERAKNALREQEISNSRMFAALADAATERGDTTEALSLALRGLPQSLADIANWPDTPEAASAFIGAASQHEFERLILSGHGERVRSVAFSPDGTRLASGSDDRTVRLWDVASGQETARLEGHGDRVWSVAFSPDGTRLASGSADGTVRLWDVASGQETARLEGHGDRVYAVAFSPDGTRLASGSDDRTVRLWEVASGRETARLAGHGGSVWSVAFSPDGTRLASGSDDRTVRLWDVARGQKIARLAGHGDRVWSVAFSPDGTRLASGSDDRTVRLWDVARGQETARLEGHGGRVWSVAFSPDGTRLASGSEDRTVRLWDVASGAETARLAGHGGSVWSVAFSPDGTRLASGSGDRTVRLWEVARGQETARLAGHDGRVWSVAFSPDGTRLASGSDDGTVRLWDVARGQETARLEGDGGSVLSVAFSPDGTRLASGSQDGTVRLWDVASGQETARLEGHGGVVISVGFSPDGTRLASGSEDGTARLWEVASGQEIARLEGHGGSVLSVAFSPDGTRLASGSTDGTVRLWDVARGQETARLAGHGDWVLSVAFSPDGTRLASGSEDRTVRLWEVASGQEAARLEGHGGWVSSVAFSPDGTRLASGSDDRTVRLWEVASGTEIARLEGHGARVWSVAFSPDGTRLASGSEDRTVRLWRPPVYRTLAELLAMSVSEKGIVELAKQGQIRSAVDHLTWLRRDPRGRPVAASTFNSVCWDGALNGHAARVLDICADAVAKASDDVVGEYRDSRGVALALTGDLAGASEDFDAFIQLGAGSEAEIEQRRGWIEALRAGQNPLTPEVLEQLEAR